MGSLEIRVKSAFDLKDQSAIGKMNPYVTVTLSSDWKLKQKTEVHTSGGINPKWKGVPMRFSVSEEMSKNQNLKLIFKIMAEKSLGDAEVGEVRLLVKELFQIEQMEETLSYGVTTPSGKTKGLLNFTYKIIRNSTKGNMAGCYAPPAVTLKPSPASYETDLYPPPPHVKVQPQYEVAAPNPPQPKHYQQPSGNYPPAQHPPAQHGYPPAQHGYPPAQHPPAQHGYPPAQQSYPHCYPPNQIYAPPPPGAYPNMYPRPQNYAPVDNHQKREVKTPKKGGFLPGLGKAALFVGSMVAGDLVPGLLEMGVGGAAECAGGTFPGTAYTDIAGASYMYDLSSHYSSIPSAIG